MFGTVSFNVLIFREAHHNTCALYSSPSQDGRSHGYAEASFLPQESHHSLLHNNWCLSCATWSTLLTIAKSRRTSSAASNQTHQSTMTCLLHLTTVAPINEILISTSTFLHLSHWLPMLLDLAHISNEEIRPALLAKRLLCLFLLVLATFSICSALNWPHNSAIMSLIEYHTFFSLSSVLMPCQRIIANALLSLPTLYLFVLMKMLGNRVAVPPCDS